MFSTIKSLRIFNSKLFYFGHSWEHLRGDYNWDYNWEELLLTEGLNSLYVSELDLYLKNHSLSYGIAKVLLINKDMNINKNFNVWSYSVYTVSYTKAFCRWLSFAQLIFSWGKSLSQTRQRFTWISYHAIFSLRAFDAGSLRGGPFDFWWGGCRIFRLLDIFFYCSSPAGFFF